MTEPARILAVVLLVGPLLLAGPGLVPAQGATQGPLTLNIHNPAPEATVNGTVEVHGNASSEDGEIQVVEVRVDEGPWAQAEGTSNWTFSWDTTTVPEGAHTLHVRANSTQDDSITVQRNVTVTRAEDGGGGTDGNQTGGNGTQEQAGDPPNLTMTAPVDGETVSGEVLVRGSAQDPEGELRRVEIRVDDGPWANVSGLASWVFFWNTTEVENGEHQITVRAWDQAQASATESVTVTVDNTPEEAEPEPENQAPNLTIESPEDGDTVEGTLIVQGLVEDDGDGLVSVEITVDGQRSHSVATQPGEPFEVEIPTDGWKEGEHRVSAVANDGQARSEEAAVTFTYKPASSPSLPGVALLVVIFVVGSGGLLLWSRS